MTSGRFDHIGILVADLKEAVPRLSVALGLTFTEVIQIPPTSTGLVEEGRGPLAEPNLFCYSYEGPPYIEVIQAQRNGIYSLSQGEGVHHIGFREDDVERVLEHFEGCGMVREATRREPNDGDAMYTAFARGLHGLRIELSSTRRPHILQRLAADRPHCGSGEHQPET